MLIDSAQLRSKVKLKQFQSENLLKAHHPQAYKLLTSSAIAASLMLSPAQALPTQAALPSTSTSVLVSSFDIRQAIKDQLKTLLPPRLEPLTPTQEAALTELFHQDFGIHAVPELEGNRLNHVYGYIGAEQHLPRFPGDTAFQHDAYIDAGITPGLGAWGYVPDSQKEKYYVAVQTLYLPDWQVRLPYLRDWYKFRKVIVVNPDNGKAVIAVIADSGPSYWTGKQFGGSPEVMHYLDRKDGAQKGMVVLYFVDDPQNQIPLGPLEYNLEKGPPRLT